MLTPEIQNMILIVVVAIVSVVIGVLFARLANKRSARTRPALDATPEMKQEGYSDIAHLWYSPATKRIITEMGTEFYKEFSGMSPDGQKKALRLAELFTDWARPAVITEEKPTIAIAETPVEAAADTPAEAQGAALTNPAFDESLAQTVVSTRPGATKPLPFVESEPKMAEARPPIPVIQPLRDELTENPIIADEVEPYNPLKAEEKMAEAQNLQSKTIAGQISDIIADMIQSSPLKEKGVRLIERPDHGVDVWFGIEKFDGIDAIPYPEVKQLIKAAATRWEQEGSQK